jgi:hypothetical protein
MAQEPTRPRQRAKRGVAEENLSSVAIEAVTPTEDNIREVLTRVEDVFNGLGTDAFPGTIIPAGSKNNAKEAADFVLADKLVKLAEERKKNASEAAEKSGVFGDPENYVLGDTVMVFSDPNFSINVKMGKPSKMIKKDLVQKAAEEFLGKKAAEFMEACLGDRAATKQIIVSMK